MRLSNFLRAAAGKLTTAEELQHALEAAVKKHFPKSQVKTRFDPHSGRHSVVTLYFTVAGNKSELLNGITENDLSYTILFVYGIDQDGKLAPELSFEPVQGGSILIKPLPGSHMAYDSTKVPLRKKKGTPEQIVQHVDKYFENLHRMLVYNKNLLPDDHLKLIEHNL